MNFPVKLLPNSQYKYIVCDLSEYFLARFTNTNNIDELIDPVTGFIRQAHICLPSQHCSDLSTNLLGVFEVSNLQIELTEEGKEHFKFYCEPNIEVSTPIYNKDFVLNTKRHFWIIIIGAIHNTIVDYTKSNLPFKAKCLVLHTPMKWNYWHFSIRWLTDQGFWHNLSEKEKEKLTKRLGHEARAHIANFAKIEKPNYSELEKECYLKSN